MCGGLRLEMCEGLLAYYARVMDDQSTGSSAVQQARVQGIADLLRRSALRHPAKLALVSGEVRWSFAEFDEAVNRTACALSARRVEQGQRVALLSHNCWQYATLNFALARLGAVMVPINFMLGADEIAFVLEHSGASGIIVEDALHPAAQSAIATAGMDDGVRGWIDLAAQPAPPGWENVAAWAEHPDDGRRR
jgi:fatty-acyl-CoA synthase